MGKKVEETLFCPPLCFSHTHTHTHTHTHIYVEVFISLQSRKQSRLPGVKKEAVGEGFAQSAEGWHHCCERQERVDLTHTKEGLGRVEVGDAEFVVEAVSIWE